MSFVVVVVVGGGVVFTVVKFTVVIIVAISVVVLLLADIDLVGEEEQRVEVHEHAEALVGPRSEVHHLRCEVPFVEGRHLAPAGEGREPPDNLARRTYTRGPTCRGHAAPVSPYSARAPNAARSGIQGITCAVRLVPLKGAT